MIGLPPIANCPVPCKWGGVFRLWAGCGSFLIGKVGETMANPNPSPKTRIGAPNGPKPGKTAEAKRLEILNAEAAMRIRARMLQAVERKLTAKDDESDEAIDDVAFAMVEAAMLKLLTDSETRGLGAPVQPVDHSSTDGSMTPRVLDATKLSTEALREIMGAVGDKAAEPDAS